MTPERLSEQASRTQEKGVTYNVCPDCKNTFLQPFVCTTCGAQKLYDETVRSQAATIDRLTAEVAELRRALTAMPCDCTKYEEFTGGPVITCEPQCERCKALGEPM